MKCTSYPKAGCLCGWTILGEQTSTEGKPAYFEVRDLEADERFQDLEFVTDHPRFRYYCGVPLRTNTGTAIGSVFVLDTQAREPMSTSHLGCTSPFPSMICPQSDVLSSFDRRGELHDAR